MSIMIDQQVQELTRRLNSLAGEVAILRAAHAEHVQSFNALSSDYAHFKANLEGTPVHVASAEKAKPNGRG